jgi:hypothetical protein
MNSRLKNWQLHRSGLPVSILDYPYIFYGNMGRGLSHDWPHFRIKSST